MLLLYISACLILILEVQNQLSIIERFTDLHDTESCRFTCCIDLCNTNSLNRRQICQ